MEASVAIIGGTGVGELLLSKSTEAVHIPTPSGLLRARRLEHQGTGLLLLSRHSAGHKVPPHKVLYGAMALGLRQVGVKFCLASAAVGSLRPEWGPGTLVACHDLYDLTGRNLTLFDRQVVHTDFSFPFAERPRQAMLEAAKRQSISLESKGIYVCGNGPRYETPHEIEVMKRFGDVVGMTAASEAILMREAGIDYACLAVVTNLAAGIGEGPLSHEEVVAEMKSSGRRAVEIMQAAAVALSSP